MSEKQNTDSIRISQVLAGALAAVTAALLGSTMGVAGTIAGAGLASIVSTVGGALYLRSIQRTKQGVRTVRAKVVGRSGGTTVLVSPDDPEDTPGEEVAATAEESPEQPSPTEPRRQRWPTLVAGGVLAFALGMLAITGVEWLRGESLSGGTGTTFGSVVAPHRGTGSPDDSDTPADPATPPPSTTTTTPSSRAEPTEPTTTSSEPTSESSTPTTTPPTTTTTTEQTPGGTIPPSN